MTSQYMLRRQEREERMKRESALNQERKKAIGEFEFMTNLAEARAISNFSLENPLNEEQYKRFMELGKLLGVRE